MLLTMSFIRQQVTHCVKSRNKAWGWCKWVWTKWFNGALSGPFPFEKKIQVVESWSAWKSDVVDFEPIG